MKRLKFYILGIIFVGIILILFSDKLLKIDMFVIEYISNIRTDLGVDIMKIITFFGSATFLILLSLFLLIFVRNKNKYYVIFTLIFIYLTNTGLKLIFERERPSDMVVLEESFSFPSGHSMVSAAFYGMIIYLIIKSKLKSSLKLIYTILLTTLIILIGYSRIYLGVHYFSDVYSGIMISMLYVLLFILIENITLKKVKKNRKKS